MWHTVIILGNLGRDPEMRYTPSGTPVTNFSVASNRQYKTSDGETVKETIWFRISTWGKLAETCNNYLQKGRTVLIEGRLVPDKKTGSPRIWEGQNGPGASYEVDAATVRFVGKTGEPGEALEGSGESTDTSSVSEPDEIPF